MIISEIKCGQYIAHFTQNSAWYTKFTIFDSTKKLFEFYGEGYGTNWYGLNGIGCFNFETINWDLPHKILTELGFSADQINDVLHNLKIFNFKFELNKE